MSAVVRRRDLRRQVGKRTCGQRDLAVGSDAFGNFDATDVEAKHQRRDQREFDRGSAAPVAAEVTQ